MLPSDIRSIYQAYNAIYEEVDLITEELVEEVVEELIQECVEFGYDFDEAVSAIEESALEYFDEAKVTYGSDTESPEERRKRAEAKVGEKRVAARKAAVKGAVEKVKAKASGAKAAAGIAASIAKDEARRVGRKAAHTVSHNVQKKKAEVKSGVKSLLGKGLRKAAGAVGKVAQKAAGAASRLGEEVVDEGYHEPKFGKKDYVKKLAKRGGMGMGTKEDPHGYRDPKMAKVGAEFSKRKTAAAKSKKTGEPDSYKAEKESQSKFRKEEYVSDTWDVVLEYLIANGHADTNSEALYIMSQMNEEMIQSILDEDAKYDRNRKRAAQRAQARNEARARGQTGAVPGVGYVSPRPERATYRDSAGVERHHSGAKMPDKK